MSDNKPIIKVTEDKRGKVHIDIYDKVPTDPSHTSVHINIKKDGKGNIVDTTKGGKEITDTKCYLTTACMRHFQDDFDDNCYELTVLRWFRDNFVSNEDIELYYQVAPIIVKNIEKLNDNNKIYNYIYEFIVEACVKAIENGDYDFAYNRYKNSVLALNEQFGDKEKEKGTVFVKTLTRYHKSALA